MADFNKPIKITISDPETGDVLRERVVANDYCLITAGNRYVKSLQVMGRTHMIAVAVDSTPSTAPGTSGEGAK